MTIMDSSISYNITPPQGGDSIRLNQVEIFRFLTLRQGLKLELHGLRRRGRSAYSIVKAELGFKGNKRKVFEQLSHWLDTEVLPKYKGEVTV